MSTFNISDITVVGAYEKAVATAEDSDRRNAGRHFETGEGSNVVKFLKTLVRRSAAATAEIRATADRPAARPV